MSQKTAIDAASLRQQWDMLTVGPYTVPEIVVSSRPALPPRVCHMIDILLANAEEICNHPYGHIELHYKGEQVQGKIEHPLAVS